MASLRMPNFPKYSTNVSSNVSRDRPRRTIDPHGILRLMHATNGVAKGNVSFRKGDSESATWWNAPCFIDAEYGSLKYEIAGASKRSKSLINDLRGHDLWIADDIDGVKTICIGSPSRAYVVLYLQAQDPEYLNHWFAALLCWKPLTSDQRPGNNAARESSKPLVMVALGASEYFRRPFPDNEASILAETRATLIEDLNSPQRSTTLDIACIIHSSQELTVHQGGDSILLVSVQLNQMPKAAIQRLSQTVSGFSRSLVIQPRYAMSVDACSTLKSICLSFDSKDTYETWFALLRACARPELYQLPYSAPNTEPAVLRVEHSLELRIKRVKLSDIDHKEQAVHAKHDELARVPSDTQGLDQYYVVVCIDGQLRARSSKKFANNGNISWIENYEFPDLARSVSEASIRLYRMIQRQTKPKSKLLAAQEIVYCGECRIRFDSLKHGHVEEYSDSLIDDAGFRYGGLTFSVKYKRNHILGAKEYEAVSSQLHTLSNEFTVVMSNHLPSRELPVLAEYLLDIFQSSGWANQWLKILIEKEIGTEKFATHANDGWDDSEKRSKPESNAFTLFRGNSLLSKALDMYMKRLGQNYLEGAIGDVVRDIVRANVDCEIDPSKADKGADLSTNLSRLKDVVRNLWLRIFGSVYECPAELRLLFQHIQNCARRRFEGGMKFARYTGVSAFVFLRFFCAAIFNPSGFGLTDEHPKHHAQRTLVLAAKTVQGLANKKFDFSDKELWMAPMNQLCSDYALQFETFIDSICNVSEEEALEATKWADVKSKAVADFYERLSHVGREGCLLVPGLADPSLSLASLIEIWLDNRGLPNFEEESAETELLEDFDSACQKVRNTTRLRASQVDYTEDTASVISRSWAALAEDMESNPYKYWTTQEIVGSEKAGKTRPSPSPVVHTGPQKEPSSDDRPSTSSVISIGSSPSKTKKKEKRTSPPRKVEDNALRKLGWMSSRRDDEPPVNLDFDARVPIPISVFPSTYRSDTQVTEQTDIQVEGNANLPGRGGREERYSYSATGPRRDGYQTDTRTESRVYESDSRRQPYRREDDVRSYERDYRGGQTDVNVDVDLDVERRRYGKPYRPYVDAQIDVKEQVYDREYQDNRGDARFTADADFRGRENFRAEETVNFGRHKHDMGYYDEDGNYHSFRHGLHRAAERVGERIAHPLHPHRHYGDREDVTRVEVDTEINSPAGPRYREDRDYRGEYRDYGYAGAGYTGATVGIDYNTRVVARGGGPNTITIPCHHIRVGDLVYLQGRVCQVIRISTSSQTGQHRYLGVDLYTKQLYEESSFSSNPSDSVYVQSMLGPVFKQYRVLDIRGDGRVVAMTENGDIRQGLPVLDQGQLYSRLQEVWANGRGSVRVLVINDGGREIAVDYKVIHGSRL